MRSASLLLFLFLGTAGAGPVQAQAPKFTKPKTLQPTAEQLKSIQEKTRALGGLIGSLGKQGVRDPGLADVEIFHQAAGKIVAFGEFYSKDSVRWTLDALDRGMLRARLLATGLMPWTITPGASVVHAYRSRIDRSVQPYAVAYPAAYGKMPGKRWPLDVVLHGRDGSLTEVKFLERHREDKALGGELDRLRLEIYGRGNNAYRWAGEVDVFEALDSFLRRERAQGRGDWIDTERIVLRGFSMGGAGTWHLGLHWPDRWAAMQPGAGFTTTRGYIGNLPDKLPAYQEACLHIYDAVDYAANAREIPLVAYSGGQDPQKLAADLIETRLKKLGLPMVHVIAPDLKHVPPRGEWLRQVDGHLEKFLKAGRKDYPSQVRFVTYTLKYPSCRWVEILGLQRHYERAEVDAQRTGNGFEVRTTNVRQLHLHLPDGVAEAQNLSIDGHKFRARPWVDGAGGTHLYLTRMGKEWRAVWPQLLVTERLRRPQKRSGLQGPIDDAFTGPFLCVRGTGKPWHARTAAYAEKNLERFRAEWARYLRGSLPVIDDVDLTNAHIAGNNLILFGDPASNSVLAQVLETLPLRWNEKEIVLGATTVSAADHVPVLVQPNPLNPDRYLVLNSGHTFREADFKGTNALLYPRLGDYALLRLGDEPLAAEVAAAGLFDEFWQVPK